MGNVQHAMVLGGGSSGWGAARLLRRMGARVVVVDRSAKAECPATFAVDPGVDFLSGRETLPERVCDLAVISPGIAATAPWVRVLRQRGVPIWSELELASRHASMPLIAVTGSNGKSTLVKLLADALNANGRSAVACGNYGRPLSEIVCEAPAPDWAVVEVSSFQLEWVATFRPRMGVLLNLQSDHLDRHGTMATYAALKRRMFERQQPDDLALLPHGFSWPMAADVPLSGRLQRFGSDPAADWRYRPGGVQGVTSSGVPVQVALEGSYFDNAVLGPAVAAAACILAHTGLPPAAIAAAIAAFEPLPHRMSLVAERAGVRYVDDSKATNLAALAGALSMVSGPTRLIAGGRLKERGLNEPKELLTLKVEKVYLIGESAEAMASAWSDGVPCERCGTLAGAVAAATREARAGETVLLSPGCASFDQFDSYVHRGNTFRELVVTQQVDR